MILESHNRSWKEKCAIIIYCWIFAIFSFVMMKPMIPEEMLPIVIFFKVWLFVAVPIIMLVAQKFG